MRRLSSMVGIGVSILLSVSMGYAQQTSTTSVPNLIRYGGTLKDTNGAIPVTTGVTFAIYKQQDGGAPVWLETQNITPDATGQYSVLLGSTTSTGLPSDLFAPEEQRWLGVQVQGQPEQARVLLVSVPYALKAHEAETLAGRSISDFVLAKDANQPNSGVGAVVPSPSGSAQAGSAKDSKSPSKTVATAGPTNFSGATSDQVIKVTQTGTGNAITATAGSTGTSNTILAGLQGPGVAIFGQAYSTSAQAYGVEGSTASTIGIGLLGLASASSGYTYGLKGYANSPSGTGVRGIALSASGSTYGVSGATASPTGTGMWGQSQASNGGTGVWGQSLATSGAATGVLANAASDTGSGVVATETSGTGVTYGLQAIVTSPNGTAALLHNTGGGALLVGTTGPINNPTKTFSVDGLGNVSAAGTYAAGTVNVAGTYQVSGTNVLSIGNSADDNVFLGVGAGSHDTAGQGQHNTFSGFNTGLNNTTGAYNTFLGSSAGSSNTTGSSNVYIANTGASADNNTIRIGTLGTGHGQQHVTYIAGIYNATSSSGVAVYINSSGQLGTLTSSLRFKEQVRDMGDSTNALMKLRPVTFFYKPEYANGPRTLQFGLVAEEVAKIYPELVAYDNEGNPYTIRYQYLATILLNEAQKQFHRAETQAEVIKAQEQKIDSQQQKIESLEQRLSRIEALMGTPVRSAENESPRVTTGQ